MSEKLSLEEVWRLAIQSETEAQQVYQEMAEMVEDSSLKNLFAFLVEQENKHQQLLEDEYDKYFTPDY